MNDRPASDIEEQLRSLFPEPLKCSRDEMFFRAGQAAARHGVTRLLWPLSSAALVLVSAGLSIALYRQADALNTALAMAPRVEVRIAEVSDQSEATVAEVAVAESWSEDSALAGLFIAGDRWRHWQQLASLDHLPPGRLTAMGWVETPAGSEPVPAPSEDELNAQPTRRPMTYLDWLRSQREG